MIDKKCVEVLKILDEEIDLAYATFLELRKKAETVESPGIRCKIKDEADKWQCRYAGLLKVYSRFLKEIEP